MVKKTFCSNGLHKRQASRRETECNLAIRHPRTWNTAKRICLILVSAATCFPQSPKGNVASVQTFPSTVSVHELAHHVPRRAGREFKNGLKARDNGDMQGAILHFQRALAIDPDYTLAINGLAVSYAQTDQFDLAIEQFQKALALDGRGWVYGNLALTYIGQGRFSDAEHVLRRGLVSDPLDKRNLGLLGFSLVLQNRFTPEAEKNLQTVASEWPVAKLWLGAGFLASGNIETSRRWVSAYVASGDRTGGEYADQLIRALETARQGGR